MPSVKIVNMQGAEVGEITLSQDIFGQKMNEGVVHSAVRAQLSNNRQGTKSTLTRAEVRGGGKKPWRQKGTGRARQGSIRNPQWKGGGVVFAPKPRSFRIELPKKVRRLALKCAMSAKVDGGDMIVIDKLDIASAKTKDMVTVLKAIGAQGKALIVLPERNEGVYRSAGNLQGIKTAYVNTLNVYDILNYDKFIVVEDAVKQIEEVYA